MPQIIVAAGYLARHHLDVPKRPEGFLLKYFPKDLQARNDRLAIDLFGEIVRLDARLIKRVCRSDREASVKPE